MDQQDLNSLGLLGILDVRLIYQLSKYLLVREVLQLGLTNSFFKEYLLNFKKREIHLEQLEQVTDDGIKLYLELDISDIYDKITAIMATVETKDQGWASASYSTSWVTLTLFNNPQDYLTHGVQPFEHIIHSNYREAKYAQRKATITEIMTINDKNKQKQETLLGIVAKGEFQKLGIVQKCQYPGWQCFMKSGKIEVWYRD
ncbi:unnamed protein product (macronuclear) [Paramecium tetraurelia]|uniref:F-box domain-containing protein n=1 Tax=Paramecium tetraurelia TaxID=5888 RepID=A0C3M8_PARTE|nr:uncharacterized protein GSPATT00034874001 [Paramecium tetraurelia]CAK65395.1 unnamed protein product [Paramecium tetraurelia]|eukprot:XP_001432792.1 hypothetical protein (macronuclear) [Paramecium tetraurelia strain d4-2]